MTKSSGKKARKSGPVEAPKSEQVRLSRGRKWTYRLLAAVLVPALFFGLLEGGLRVFGYGYRTAFLIRKGDYYESNFRFGWRFFPRPISRAPLAIRLPASKPAGTYRIFVIGGSAAQGYPDPNYSFSRFLEAMLRERFPQRRFEVANAAMTAANSHVMVPVARDCAKLQPDLLIVYMGNNEVVGPFGAGTVLEGYSPNLAAIRASLWAKTTRVGQLMSDASRGSDTGPIEWGGMAMFLEKRISADDPRLQTVYGHFRRNLEDICKAATSRGAGVLLCTVPVNLRHSAPFASLHRENMSEQELGTWTAIYDQGVAAEQDGRLDEAIGHFEAASAIDDPYADLHFRLGRCALGLDRPDQAREHFVRARELDALRFRADAAINDTIRQVAANAGEAVRLVDAERAFETAADVVAGCPGEELFFEHVHPNYRGNYELAREVFKGVSSQLAVAAPGDRSVDPPSFQRCSELLALTHWDRLRNALSVWRMTARPPFTHQLNHSEMRRRMLRRREALWAARVPISGILNTCHKALAAGPDDAMLHTLTASIYGKQRNYPVAMKHVEAARSLLPNEPRIYLVQARVELHQGKVSAAKVSVARYLDLLDHTLPSYQTVVAMFKSRNHMAEAEAYARQAVDRMPRQPPVLTLLGEVLTDRRNYDQAEETLTEATAIDAAYAKAWWRLGEVQLQTRRIEESVKALHRAVELDPMLHEAIAAIGSIYFRLQRHNQAKPYLARAIALSPDNLTATAQYAELLCLEGEVFAGVQFYRRAMRIRPDLAPVAGKLAWMLATAADIRVRNSTQAVFLAERAVAGSRGRPETMVSLAAAYAADGQFDKAVGVANRALSMARQAGNAELARRLSSHLGRYTKGEVLRIESYDRVEGW